MKSDFYEAVLLFALAFYSGFIWGRLWEWGVSQFSVKKRPASAHDGLAVRQVQDGLRLPKGLAYKNKDK